MGSVGPGAWSRRRGSPGEGVGEGKEALSQLWVWLRGAPRPSASQIWICWALLPRPILASGLLPCDVAGPELGQSPACPLDFCCPGLPGPGQVLLSSVRLQQMGPRVSPLALRDRGQACCHWPLGKVPWVAKGLRRAGGPPPRVPLQLGKLRHAQGAVPEVRGWGETSEPWFLLALAFVRPGCDGRGRAVGVLPPGDHRQGGRTGSGCGSWAVLAQSRQDISPDSCPAPASVLVASGWPAGQMGTLGQWYRVSCFWSPPPAPSLLLWGRRTHSPLLSSAALSSESVGGLSNGLGWQWLVRGSACPAVGSSQLWSTQ